VQQYGLPAWGASGPYQKVYEKFGITGSSKFRCINCDLVQHVDKIHNVDIAAVGKKVVDFYKQKGGEVVSPLVKAIRL
jgi:transketolase